jgi:hypothetical protein
MSSQDRLGTDEMGTVAPSIVFDDERHGTEGAYKRGCRCDACRSVDLGLMREMADAVDQDRGHSNSILTRMLRGAADEIRELRKRVDEQQKYLDYLESV